MAIRRLCLSLALIAAIPVGAQSHKEAQSLEEPDAPLSAIGWLSGIVQEPADAAVQKPNDVADNALPAEIDTTTLDETDLDAVGLLPTSVTGFDPRLWGSSSSQVLAGLITDLRTDLPPPLARLLQRLLLAELRPTIDSATTDRLFLARVDRFLRQGALDHAQALLDRAGTQDPALFSRWFDISLLTDHDNEACARMLADDGLNATHPAQIFCLVRSGDWQAADEVFVDGATRFTPKQAALLERFLDPEAADGAPFLATPDRVTPLVFRLHQAIGEPLPAAILPSAFAYSALASTQGWKSRIDAAERLSRSRSIPRMLLLAIYSERSPAASGGVWDRVAAVQKLENAIEASDATAVANALPDAIQTMRRAELEPALADLFATDLLAFDLEGDAAQLAVRLGLMSDAYADAARSSMFDPDTTNPLLGAIARDEMAGVTGTDTLEQAIVAGFAQNGAGAELDTLIAQGNIGEAALRAITMLQDGASADPAQIEHGLAALRLAGFDDTARQMGLFITLMRATP